MEWDSEEMKVTDEITEWNAGIGMKLDTYVNKYNLLF